MELIYFLNINSGAVQSISTIVLVLITAFYAWQTYKTNKLIYRQVAPNIKLTVVGLRSSLLDYDRINEINNCLNNAKGNTYNILFVLEYLVNNQSASFGTIEKPKLILTCKKSKKQLFLSGSYKKGGSGCYKTKEIPSEIFAAYKLFEIENSIDNTVYLRPGEKKSLEESYVKFLICNKPNEDLLYFIKNPSDIDYKLSYFDENNKLKYLPIKADKLSSEKFY